MCVFAQRLFIRCDDVSIVSFLLESQRIQDIFVPHISFRNTALKNVALKLGDERENECMGVS